MTYQPIHHSPETTTALSETLDEAIEVFQRLQDARATPGAFLRAKGKDGELCAQLEVSVQALGYALLDYIWQGGELRLAPAQPPAAKPPGHAPTNATFKEAVAVPEEAVPEEASAPAPPESLAWEAEEDGVLEEDAVEGVIEEAPRVEMVETSPAPMPSALVAEITPEVLERLRASFEHRAVPDEKKVEIHTVDDGWLFASNNLDALASQLGNPGAFKSKGAVKSELGVLRKHTSAEAIARWGSFPDEVRVALTHFVAARCRALQEAPSKYRKGLDLKEEVADIFPRLRAPIERERLCFVHGLALDHRPAHGNTWQDDVSHWSSKINALRQKYAPAKTSREPFNTQKAITAVAHLIARKASPVAIRHDLKGYIEQGLNPKDERLLSTLAPVAEFFPEDDPRWAKLHQGWAAIRAREEAASRSLEASLQEVPEERAEVEDEDLAEESVVDERWSHWAYVAGRTIAIIGGDRRDSAADRIAESFKPAALVWPKVTKKGGMRRVTSMCSRIDNQSIDLVLVLNRFISHKASNKIIGACKKANVPYACIERGYGVAQLAEAIERFLPPHPIYLADVDKTDAEEE